MQHKERMNIADEAQDVRENIYNRAHEENETIENAFVYHAPSAAQQEKHKEIRQAGKDLAYLLEYHCPKSAEYDQAVIRLDECIMWANAAIARNN